MKTSSTDISDRFKEQVPVNNGLIFYLLLKQQLHGGGYQMQQIELENKTDRKGKVIFLSLIAAPGGFLFGYDSGVINGTVDALQPVLLHLPIFERLHQPGIGVRSYSYQSHPDIS